MPVFIPAFFSDKNNALTFCFDNFCAISFSPFLGDKYFTDLNF